MRSHQRSFVFGLLFAGVAVGMAGCLISLGDSYPDDMDMDGNAGSSSTTMGSSTGVGNPTDPGSADCTIAEDCPTGESICEKRICTAEGKCDLEIVRNKPISPLDDGDCKVLKCDGEGKLVIEQDDMDRPNDDGKSCTEYHCTNAEPQPVLKQVNAACEGGNKCSLRGKCVPEYCLNSQWDKGDAGTETSPDCGGLCDPCEAERACGNGFDCLSQVCSSSLLPFSPMLCQAPTCKDDTKNGDETDIDCGGSCSKPLSNDGMCIATKSCKVHADCKSRICKAGTCQEST
jgi:hypothetical protein